MAKAAHPRRVLAIDPTTRGFGYVVLEGSTRIIDWGVKSSRSTTIEKEIQVLSKIKDLIRHCQPQCIVIEETRGEQSRRCGRVRLLLGTVRNIAVWEGIKSRNISTDQVKRVFGTFGATTKHEIACVIAEHLPDLAPYLPKVRKPWMPEDYRMAIFDAAAMALTYFYSRRVG